MRQDLKPVFTESRPTLVDKRYKTGLLKTMLHCAHALSSKTEAFNQDCAKLCFIFSRLDYAIGLINSTINIFAQNIATKPEKKTDALFLRK